MHANTASAWLTLEGHKGEVTGVTVTPDGQRAVTSSWDRTLIVGDLDHGQRLRTLEGHRA
jgi:WD40 repeat protein